MGSTVSLNVVVSVNSPSETTTVMSEKPCQLVSGEAVKDESSECTFTVKKGELEIADNKRTSPVSISVNSKSKKYVSSSSMEILEMDEIIGASFTGLIVNKTSCSRIIG